MKVSYFRIISLIITITLLFQPLSVYATSTDEVTSENLDDILSSYASQIQQQTEDFFDTYKIETENISSLWSSFIATWKITKATAYYGATTAQLIAGCLKDFISWLRDNYFYGYFDGNKEYFYVGDDPRLEAIKQLAAKRSELVPSENYYPNNLMSNYVYELGYSSQFPFDFGGTMSGYCKKINWGSNINSFPANTTELSIGSVGHIRTGLIDTSAQWLSTDYGVRFSYSHVTSDTKTLCYGLFGICDFYDSELVDDKYYYWDSVRVGSTGYQYFQPIASNNNYSPKNNEIIFNTYTSTGGDYSTYKSPFYYYGYEFYSCVFGDHLFSCDNHMIFYFNNQFYDVTDKLKYDSTVGKNYIDMSGIVTFDDLPEVDNAINNYYTVINNTINEYPSITPDLLLYILNDYLNKIIDGVDISDYLEDLDDRIQDLQDQLNEELQDIADIKSALAKMKKYLKSIDDNITHIMERFDSLFLQSGIFFLDAKLDYLYNHLSSDMTRNTNAIITAINNISSNGGSSGDINFGDFIIDLDITLTNLFTLNNEQKSELESDIDTIKAPFVWVATLGNNINGLLSSMVRRSAQYSGDSYTNDFSSLNDAFSSSVSDNASVPPGTDSSVPGGSAALSSNSQNNTPTLMVHFGNATSDINYGGDVTVLDFSWYAPYKPIVDNIIVIFAWAFFIIIFFRRIPSFIHGDDAKEEG